jgi:hypothetical protein
MGIEPTSEAWEASILPLYDARSVLILLHLGCDQSRILFSNIFQNINFIAKLGREFCPYLVERNLSGVACRHRLQPARNAWSPARSNHRASRAGCRHYNFRLTTNRREPHLYDSRNLADSCARQMLLGARCIERTNTWMRPFPRLLVRHEHLLTIHPDFFNLGCCGPCRGITLLTVLYKIEYSTCARVSGMVELVSAPRSLPMKTTTSSFTVRCFLSATLLAPAFIISLSISLAAQQPTTNSVDVQREAMRKLSFLAGHWSGPAIVRGPGEPLHFRQTEDVEYKLDGLVLLIEGKSTGADGKIAFSALATIAYDDASHTYHFRAFHDGHYLDTELSVPANGFSWGFTAGPAHIVNTMHLTDKDEWDEVTEVTVGSNPPYRSVDMQLQHQP